MCVAATVVDSPVRESLSLLPKRIQFLFLPLPLFLLRLLEGAPHCLAVHKWCFQKLDPWLPSPLTPFL